MNSKNKLNTLWQFSSPTEPPQTSALNEHLKTDVAIIGAGICGLSAALHLSQKNVDVICIEKHTIGWGASGRNNGQIIPGLKLDPNDVIKTLGNELGDKLVRCSGDAPDLAFSLIKQYAINCDAVQQGWIQPGRSSSAIKAIESRVEQWLHYQAPVEMLPENTLGCRLGTDWYKAAWLDKRGGSVNPLAYTYGLANAAIKEGADIYTSSPVVSIEKETNQWRIKTASGEITASRLLICTNAYGDEINDKLRRSVVPVRTAQIASKPLSKKDWQRILPKGEAASDTSRLLTSFRITPDKRLSMGGSYATGGDETPILFEKLKQASVERFPFLQDAEWEYQWSGYLAITPTHLPHIFELDKDCFAPIGCNGRGIAMSTATGKAMCELITGNSDCPLPISKPTPFPFHSFRNIGIAANVAWSGLLDNLNI